MPNPSNANGLMLGGVLMDIAALSDEDCSPALRAILEKQFASWLGGGCPSGDDGAGFSCQSVYYAAGSLWAGKPSDPTNPDELTNIGGVTAGYAIDVTAGEVAWDPTEISGYNAGQNQYLKNEGGTIKWVTVSECTP